MKTTKEEGYTLTSFCYSEYFVEIANFIDKGKQICERKLKEIQKREKEARNEL